MKKIIIILCLAFVIMSAFNTSTVKPGIHGMIDPPDGANKVWAILGADSVSATPVSGKFSMEVKPGNWTLFVEAVKPYKNAVLSNVLVLETHSTDAGVIKLLQE